MLSRTRIETPSSNPDGGTGTIAVAHGTVYEPATLPGLVAEEDGRIVGLLTYTIANDEFEVVTIDAPVRQNGVGSALMAAAIDLARQAGATRLWLITTNDNLDAVRFYQRRGLRIVASPRGRWTCRRKLKPSIPLIGCVRHPAARRADAGAPALISPAASARSGPGRGRAGRRG